MEFLTHRSANESVRSSIRKLRDLSVGFCRSWLEHRHDDAFETSKDALALLDHIQNELLRHRDELKAAGTWRGSPFEVAMQLPIGDILAQPSPSALDEFLALRHGEGAYPLGSTPLPLTLEQGANKLKHRTIAQMKFNVSITLEHTIYVYTRAGMGQPGAISRFSISQFCDACEAADRARR